MGGAGGVTPGKGATPLWGVDCEFDYPGRGDTPVGGVGIDGERVGV